MDEGEAELSARARMRAAARERREARARLTRRDPRSGRLRLHLRGDRRQLGLSVKSVRRATAKAIEKRRLDCGADYVHLQVLRLTKAMRVVDLNLDKGDLKAVEPLLKVIAQLDKYHALRAPSPRPRRRRSRLAARRWRSPRRTRPKSGQKTAPKPLKSPDAGHGLRVVI